MISCGWICFALWSSYPLSESLSHNLNLLVDFMYQNKCGSSSAVDSSCYDFLPTHVEHTFSFLPDDNLTLAATCADGSPFISVLLFTWLLPLIVSGTWGYMLPFIYISFLFASLLLSFFVSRTCGLWRLFIHAAPLRVYAVFHAFTLPYTWGLILYKLVVVRYYTLACSLLVLQSTWILLEHRLSVFRQTPSENSDIDLKPGTYELVRLIIS